MEEGARLSNTTNSPCLTFVVKGLINSGKSTFFNAIFSRNISKTSMKRQTMCQTILTENYNSSTDYEAIYDSILEVNKAVYGKTEAGLQVDNIDEIEQDVALVEKFLKRIPDVLYRYVETGYFKLLVYYQIMRMD
jgi:ribosome biogenesis GTPase A